MFVIIGLAIVMGSILVGYSMAGGQISVLIQVSEFIVIGGCGLGALLVGNPPSMIGALIKCILGLLKPNPFNKAAFTELMRMLYDLFMLTRKEGLVALEAHAEEPETSEIFMRYPGFYKNHHALEFTCDTLKVIITGTVAPMDLAELMDVDLDIHHKAAGKVTAVLQNTSDAMPGFGIVAAVLGVVITMGAIGAKPEEIGHHVAAALVGTFLGILLAYGVFGPLAVAANSVLDYEASYMNCLRAALLAFARGDAPLTAVEFARRNIDPEFRISFSELEKTVKGT